MKSHFCAWQFKCYPLAVDDIDRVWHFDGDQWHLVGLLYCESTEERCGELGHAAQFEDLLDQDQDGIRDECESVRATYQRLQGF